MGPQSSSAIFVANVEHLARPIADGIVGPRGDLILLAVDRPRVTAALDRYLEAERGIGDDVDPRRRRPLPFAEDGYVFTSAGREAAKAIEKFEFGGGQRGLGIASRWASVAAAAQRPCADSSRRLTCWKRLPRRLQITARAALWSSSSRVDRNQFVAKNEHRSARTLPRRNTAVATGWPEPSSPARSADPERRKGDSRSESPGRPPTASSASIRGRGATGARSPDPRLRRFEPTRSAGRRRCRAPKAAAGPPSLRSSTPDEGRSAGLE